jgi:hypothetical protein
MAEIFSKLGPFKGVEFTDVFGEKRKPFFDLDDQDSKRDRSKTMSLAANEAVTLLDSVNIPKQNR